MNEDDPGGLWPALEPGPRTRRRIDARVDAWLDAHDTPLAAEWLALFRFSPIPAFGLLAASAVALVTTTPLLWIARALL
jgi:hypothetical protein